MKKGIIIAICAAVVVLAVVLILIFTLGGNGITEGAQDWPASGVFKGLPKAADAVDDLKVVEDGDKTTYTLYVKSMAYSDYYAYCQKLENDGYVGTEGTVEQVLGAKPTSFRSNEFSESYILKGEWNAKKDGNYVGVNYDSSGENNFVMKVMNYDPNAPEEGELPSFNTPAEYTFTFVEVDNGVETSTTIIRDATRLYMVIETGDTADQTYMRKEADGSFTYASGNGTSWLSIEQISAGEEANTLITYTEALASAYWFMFNPSYVLALTQYDFVKGANETLTVNGKSVKCDTYSYSDGDNNAKFWVGTSTGMMYKLVATEVSEGETDTTEYAVTFFSTTADFSSVNEPEAGQKVSLDFTLKLPDEYGYTMFFQKSKGGFEKESYSAEVQKDNEANGTNYYIKQIYETKGSYYRDLGNGTWEMWTYENGWKNEYDKIVDKAYLDAQLADIHALLCWHTILTEDENNKVEYLMTLEGIEYYSIMIDDEEYSFQLYSNTRVICGYMTYAESGLDYDYISCELVDEWTQFTRPLKYNQGDVDGALPEYTLPDVFELTAVKGTYVERLMRLENGSIFKQTGYVRDGSIDIDYTYYYELLTDGSYQSYQFKNDAWNKSTVKTSSAVAQEIEQFESNYVKWAKNNASEYEIEDLGDVQYKGATCGSYKMTNEYYEDDYVLVYINDLGMTVMELYHEEGYKDEVVFEVTFNRNPNPLDYVANLPETIEVNKFPTSYAVSYNYSLSYNGGSALTEYTVYVTPSSVMILVITYGTSLYTYVEQIDGVYHEWGGTTADGLEYYGTVNKEVFDELANKAANDFMDISEYNSLVKVGNVNYLGKACVEYNALKSGADCNIYVDNETGLVFKFSSTYVYTSLYEVTSYSTTVPKIEVTVPEKVDLPDFSSPEYYTLTLIQTENDETETITAIKGETELCIVELSSDGEKYITYIKLHEDGSFTYATGNGEEWYNIEEYTEDDISIYEDMLSNIEANLDTLKFNLVTEGMANMLVKGANETVKCNGTDVECEVYSITLGTESLKYYVNPETGMLLRYARLSEGYVVYDVLVSVYLEEADIEGLNLPELVMPAD
ncbi:MAG: hypothetical protein PHX51_01000 [Clostridia bacterium]|nr:hypothetical protein [Clostridia bacterium]